MKIIVSVCRCNSHKYKFETANNLSIDKLRQNLYVGKICRCSTQNRRVELSSYSNNIYTVSALRYINSKWIRDEDFNINADMSSIKDINDLSKLMVRLLYKYYPDAKVSYWEQLPSLNCVINSLYESAWNLRTLEFCRYDYTIMSDIVMVVCNEGYLNIPIIKDNNYILDSELRIDLAYIQYNSVSEHIKYKLENLCNKFVDLCNWFESFIIKNKSM